MRNIITLPQEILENKYLSLDWADKFLGYYPQVILTQVMTHFVLRILEKTIIKNAMAQLFSKVKDIKLYDSLRFQHRHAKSQGITLLDLLNYLQQL